MPHTTGPQIPEYHSTDADVNRPSKAQSQRRTKAACLQKTLKLTHQKSPEQRTEAVFDAENYSESKVPNLFSHSQGRKPK